MKNKRTLPLDSKVIESLIKYYDDIGPEVMTQTIESLKEYTNDLYSQLETAFKVGYMFKSYERNE